MTIIMPALNEEGNIALAIDTTLKALSEFSPASEILVINDGSTDSTPSIVEGKIKESPDAVRMLHHLRPQGLGSSFWDGVDDASADIVCMLPGDNENDPRQILRYLPLLNDVDIVIPFVENKEVRSKLRNLLSSIYRWIINATFGTRLKYTNGTCLYRKSLLKRLSRRNNSFFYQTDILIRLVKMGYRFTQVPYRLKKREKGRSKALTLPSLRQTLSGYAILVWDIYFRRQAQVK